jgi:hypothetical protein
MPGRGAYLCTSARGSGAEARCVQLALKRGGIARALRSPVQLDPEIVESVGR